MMKKWGRNWRPIPSEVIEASPYKEMLESLPGVIFTEEGDNDPYEFLVDLGKVNQVEAFLYGKSFGYNDDFDLVKEGRRFVILDLES